MHALLSHERAGANGIIPRKKAESFSHSAIQASAEWEGAVQREVSLIMAQRCCLSTTHCSCATGALGINVASAPKTSKLHIKAVEASWMLRRESCLALACRKAKYKGVLGSMNRKIMILPVWGLRK